MRFFTILVIVTSTLTACNYKAHQDVLSPQTQGFQDSLKILCESLPTASVLSDTTKYNENFNAGNIPQGIIFTAITTNDQFVSYEKMLQGEMNASALCDLVANGMSHANIVFAEKHDIQSKFTAFHIFDPIKEQIAQYGWLRNSRDIVSATVTTNDIPNGTIYPLCLPYSPNLDSVFLIGWRIFPDKVVHIEISGIAIAFPEFIKTALVPGNKNGLTTLADNGDFSGSYIMKIPYVYTKFVLGLSGSGVYAKNNGVLSLIGIQTNRLIFLEQNSMENEKTQETIGTVIVFQPVL